METKKYRNYWLNKKENFLKKEAKLLETRWKSLADKLIDIQPLESPGLVYYLRNKDGDTKEIIL